MFLRQRQICHIYWWLSDPANPASSYSILQYTDNPIKNHWPLIDTIVLRGLLWSDHMGLTMHDDFPLVASSQIFVIINSSKLIALTLQQGKGFGRTTHSESFLASIKWSAVTPRTKKKLMGHKQKNTNDLTSRFTSVLVQLNTYQFNT